MKRTLMADPAHLRILPLELVGPKAWAPYPRIENRDFWSSLEPEISEPILARAETELDKPWSIISATQFLEYARNGNRSRFQEVYFGRRRRLQAMVLAECIENSGQFLDEIANGIWLICEETYWGLPAHVGVQVAGDGLPDVTEPTVDLFAAETGSFLSLIKALLGDRLDTVSPLIRPRIETEIQKRILTPCFERDDFWWMGNTPKVINNWNPWITSNWLICVLLVEPTREKQVDTVEKCLRCLDRFLDIYPADGGCDEGPGYWGKAGASVFDCLEILCSATEGAIDLFANELIRNMGSFIHRTHIHENWFVNFADASAQIVPGQNVVYRFGQAIGDPTMTHFAAYLQRWPSVQELTLERALPALVHGKQLRSTKPAAPYCQDAWWPDLEVMVARDAGGTHEGLFLAAKGGHNAESHNHNDIGQFIVYRNGRPVLVDIGVETYRRETFNQERYSIWTMQSGFHNLPTINGVEQAPGRDFQARDVTYSQDDEYARFSLELAEAYPPQARLRSWRRELTLHRGSKVVLSDAFELEKPGGKLRLNLITPCRVDSEGKGTLVFRDSSGLRFLKATYPTGRLTHIVERHKITDPLIGNVWGDSLHRIVLTWENAPASGNWELSFG
jgi:hypothetical protein